MKIASLVTIALSLSFYEYAKAQDNPPPIPSGPVTYVSNPSNLHQSDYLDAPMPAQTTSTHAQAPKPLSQYTSSLENTHINFDVYKSRYDYFGLTPSSSYDRGGYSGISGKTYLPDFGLLGNKWKQAIDAQVGWIYGGALSKSPVLGIGYGLAREILPSLWIDAGYGLRHGGLPGYIGDARGKTNNKIVHDFGFCARLDDGTDTAYFGQFDLQYAFSGLNGWQAALQVGKRFLFNPSFGRSIVQLSGGITASTHYWGSSISGFDAYFLRGEAYCADKKILGGKLVPWIQASWSSSTRKKINRMMNDKIIDPFNFSAGVELRWDF